MMLKPKEIKQHFIIKDLLFMLHQYVPSEIQMQVSVFAIKLLEKVKPVGPHLIQVVIGLSWFYNGSGWSSPLVSEWELHLLLYAFLCCCLLFRGGCVFLC